MEQCIYRELGSLVREHRNKLKITQDELAARLGYATRTSVSRLENGVIRPTVNVIEKMSNLFDIPIEDFYTAIREDQKSQNGYPVNPDSLKAVDRMIPIKPLEGYGDGLTNNEYFFDDNLIGWGKVKNGLKIIVSPDSALLGAGIMNGDYVLIDITETRPQDGAYVFMKRKGKPCLRKYRILHDGKIIMFETESPSNYHESYICTQENKDDFKIIGTVVYALKKFGTKANQTRQRRIV